MAKKTPESAYRQYIKNKKKTSFADRAPDTKRMSKGGTAYNNTARSKTINKNIGKHPKQDNHKQSTSVSKGVRKQQQKSYNQTSGGRFTQGFVKNSVMVGLPKRSTATYKDSNNKKKKVAESKAYKAGEILGDLVSYGTGYGLAGKAITRATGKALAKKALSEGAEKAVKSGAKQAAKKNLIGKAEDAVSTAAGKAILKGEEKVASKIAKTKGVEKIAAKQAGKTGEVAKIAGLAKSKDAVKKDIASKAARKISQSVIADATAGTALDTAHAHGEGIDIGFNKQYLSYMGTNALLNLSMGAGMEGLSAGAKKIVQNRAKRELAKRAAARTAAGKSAKSETQNKFFKEVTEGIKKADNQKQELAEHNRTMREIVGEGADNELAKNSMSPRDYNRAKKAIDGNGYKDKTLKEYLSPEEYAERRRNIKRANNLNRRIKHSASATEREARKVGGERARELLGIKSLEVPKSAEDYLTKITEGSKYAKENGIKFSDVLEEHNGNRAEAINDLYNRSLEARAKEPVETTSAETGKTPSVPTEEDVKRFMNDNEGEIADYAMDNNLSLREAAERMMTENRTEVTTAKVTTDSPSAISIEDALERSERSGNMVKGYDGLSSNEQAKLNKAINDEDFIRAIKEDDNRGIAAIVEGAVEQDISQAEKMLRLYNEYRRKGHIRSAEETLSKDMPKETFKERVSEWFMKTAEQFTDTAESIWKYSRKVDDDLLYPLLDRARQIRSHAENMIAGDKQVIVTKDGTKEIGKSIKGIFDPIMKEGDEYYKDFQRYLFNRHNVNRYKNGKPVYGEAHTAVESEDIIAEIAEKYSNIKDANGVPKIETMRKQADEVYRYLDALLQMEYESGLISKDLYNQLKNEYPLYVPTYRRNMSPKGIVKDVNAISTRNFAAAKGSNSDLLPLHEQMIQRTRQVTDECALNDFGYRLMEDINKEQSIGNIRKVDAADVADEYVTDTAKDKLASALKETDTNYLFYVKDGGKVYEVPIDKHVFNALKDIGTPTPNYLGLGKANKIFRGLVTTYNPLFGPVNGIKDLLDAPSFSKNGVTGFLKAYPKAWKMMVTNNDLWQVYKNLGGTGGSFVEIGKLFKNDRWWNKQIFERIARVNEAIEQAPRFAEFIATLEKGGNNKENVIKALSNAKEVTVNFGRSGKVGRAVNANIAPFFNAAMQDTVRVARALEDGKIAQLLVGATVAGVAPSVVNELICGDDEHYKSLRTGDKDTNFFIPIGDGKFVKIPKGRVTSVIAMPAQRATRFAMGNVEGDEAAKGMVKSTAEQIAPKNPFTENLFTPAAEAFLTENGRTWYGADIVPSALKRLPDAEQFDENTTKIAIALGKKTNVSPKKIDYVLKQYSGVVGSLVRSNSLTGTSAATNNALVTKFITDAVTNNELQSKVYDKLEEYEKSKNSMKSTETDNLNYKYMNECATEMSKLNKKAKKIQMNDSLTDKAKLRKVREIREEQNELAREYLDNESKMRRASKKAVEQVEKGSFESDTGYAKALKQQMDVNMRGEKAVLEELDRKAKKDGKVKISVKLKEAGLSAKEYFDLQARGISLDTYNSAKSKGVSLEKYQKVQKAKKGYSGGYASQAMEMISQKLIKSEEEADVFGIKKHTYKAAKGFLDNGYTPEEVYKLSGNVDEITDMVRDKYGHNTWSDGTVVMSPEGLKKYIDSRKGVSNADRHNMWVLYAWGNWQGKNPY